MTHTLFVLDPVETLCSAAFGQLVRPSISYEAVYWKDGQRGKKRTSYIKDVFIHKDGRSCRFHTGLLPRINKFCKDREITFRLKYTQRVIIPGTDPQLPGITFRPDQLSAIQKARKHQRGIIHHATATGKTVILAGIASCFRDCRMLILVHSLDLLKQLVEDFRGFGFKNIQTIGGGKNFGYLVGDIVIATCKSFVKLEPDLYSTYFDLVMVDEAHHVSDTDGTYGRILNNLFAPLRFGFTATIPEQDDKKLAMEGLLGPIISKYAINEAAGDDVVSRPRIKIVKISTSYGIRSSREWPKVYQKGVVENKNLTDKVVSETKLALDKGDSVLVFCVKVEHGKILAEALEDVIKQPVAFIHGATDPDERLSYKKKIMSKEIRCIVCNVVWREGINIPSLNTIVNAGGGKSLTLVTQMLGRGLRRTGSKTDFFLVDFFDPSHHYLIEHFGQRISFYSENGWL